MATILLEDPFTSSPHFHVAPLASITLTDTSTSTTLYGGYVTQPAIATWANKHLEWQLDCTDYTFLSDNIIVYGTFYSQSADAIIKSLVAQANVGITANNVSAGPVIPIVQINYMTLTNALTMISRLASITTDYSWYIDYNKDIHFKSIAQTTPSTTVLSDSQFPGASSTVGNYDISTFGYVWDAASIRNSCIVRGTTYKTRYTDTWTGTGSQTTFALSFNVSTDVTPTLSVNGVSQTLQVFTQNSQQTTATTQYTLTQNANGSWVLQTGTASAPPLGASVKLGYTALAPIITRVDNTTSQSSLGVTAQMYVSDSSLTTLGTAVQRGQGELQEYQWPQERVTLKTNENFTGHIETGQVIKIQASRVPDSQNSYTQGLNGWFLVMQNNYGGVQGNYRTYELTCTRIA